MAKKRPTVCDGKELTLDFELAIPPTILATQRANLAPAPEAERIGVTVACKTGGRAFETIPQCELALFGDA